MALASGSACLPATSRVLFSLLAKMTSWTVRHCFLPRGSYSEDAGSEEEKGGGRTR